MFSKSISRAILRMLLSWVAKGVPPGAATRP